MIVMAQLSVLLPCCSNSVCPQGYWLSWLE
uniref:Uncharacterized protein n=1 Tax=Rhizophora mucronata TaxID=61149 RepID=A0A2P2P9J1_RHIMU